MASNLPWNQADFRQYLHSFQSPSPASQIQSFAQQGYAPYGHVIGTNPELFVQSPIIRDGAQPVYHIKVTATPIQLPENLPGGPEYVVTAYPNARGEREGIMTREGGKVVAHTSPDLTGPETRGVSIHPLHYDKRIQLDAEGKPIPTRPVSRVPTAGSGQLSTGQLSGAALSGQLSKGQMAAAAGDQLPENQQSPEVHGQDVGQAGGPGGSDALVHVYGGRQAITTQQLLQTSPQAAAQYYAEVQAGETLPPGVTALERGHSRAVPRPLDLQDFEAEGKPKMYSWIIPSTANIVAGAGAELSESAELSEERDVDVDQLFSQASEVFSGHEADEEVAEGTRKHIPPDTQIVSTPTDDELGLPYELRPSVIYGGVEHAPPEFSGQKGALKYKLHAVEVHQFVAMPDAGEPWILKNQMNPATTAIFGPMPMPFDPAHSGMVAPTFQRTIGLQPTPVLSPEFSRMFNHELPVVSNLLDVFPPAETAE